MATYGESGVYAGLDLNRVQEKIESLDFEKATELRDQVLALEQKQLS